MIVPYSEGEDKSFAAQRRKYTGGIRPLPVTWCPLNATEHLRRNLDAFIRSGFNRILWRRDRVVTCLLSMRMLAVKNVRSNRQGEHGLTSGHVVPIFIYSADGARHEISCVGCPEIAPSHPNGLEKTPIAKVDAPDFDYLLYTYHLESECSDGRLGNGDCEGFTITAAIAPNNFLLCQFHPEKVGPTGLRKLAGFLAC